MPTSSSEKDRMVVSESRHSKAYREKKSMGTKKHKFFQKVQPHSREQNHYLGKSFKETRQKIK